MKNYLILVLFIICFSSIRANIVIYGQIQGYDEQRLPLCHLHVTYDDENNTKTVQADSLGYYHVEIPDTYAFIVMFTGVSCDMRKFLYILEENHSDSINISIQLPSIINNQSFGKYYVIGNFNDFSHNNNVIELQHDVINTNLYYKTLNKISDTLKYQILYKTNNSDGINLNSRSFNGIKADYYEYDGQGDYISVIISNDKRYKVTLNLSDYPSENIFCYYNSNSEDVKNYIIQYYNCYNYTTYNIYYNLGKNKNNSTIILEKLTEILNIIDSKIKEAKLPSLKLFFKLCYVEFVYNNNTYTLNGLKEYINMDYINDILKEIKPNSLIWNYFPELPFYCAFLTADFYENLYIEELIKTNKSKTVVKNTLLSLIAFHTTNNDIKTKEHYTNLLNELYPNSMELKYLEYFIKKMQN